MSSLTRLSDILSSGSQATTPTPKTFKVASPQCGVCLDTGFQWVGERSSPCDCPAGAFQQRRLWLANSGVPFARRGETLASFQALPGTGGALTAAQAFVRGDITWLLLYGGTGNGKSHLCNGVAMACIEGGRRARVVNALMLVSELRGLSGTPRLVDALRDLGGIPVLAIDEYFWATDLEARWLEEIVQRRYLEKRPLLVATNLDAKSIPAPMMSRFWELGQVVLNKGQDYRRKEKL